jgi:oligopeptide transport system permease protein
MTDNNQFEKYSSIPKSKFAFSKEATAIHDLKLQTKPVGFMRDAMRRFAKNKGSVVAFGIIIFLLLFALIVPMITPYTVSYSDSYYRATLPRSRMSIALGWDFWDGAQEKELSEEAFLMEYSKGVETGHNSIKNQEYEITSVSMGKITSKMYRFRMDSYHSTGVVFLRVSLADFKRIQDYQDATGIQVIYPNTVAAKRPEALQDRSEANYWFETRMQSSRTYAVVNGSIEDGNFTYNNIYIPYDGTDAYTSKVRFEGEGNYLYNYSTVNDAGYEIRVNYYEYYIYNHTTVLKDGITEPHFFFGTTANGKDILTALGSGARFSFILSIVVASVNMFVGAIYGAIEGYYGGKADMVMEGFVEVLSRVPFMIVITLLILKMRGSSQVLVLFIAYFMTGWTGMAGLMRMQFYRFKNQEYILAARTLGAKDPRIMLKHILPNSLGTIITSSVLVIPGVIFSETSLSYLGIINLESGSLTSVGTLLAGGQAALMTSPHIVLFPSIFISLLMLSFNLFGNGLRDAFNPSLRGSEE